MINVINESEEITTDPRNIERIAKEYYKELYNHRLIT